MSLKLFMVLIGCKPEGRHIEQHDVYFGIAHELKELIPEFIGFWPETNGKMHVDGWREVSQVDGQTITIIPRLAKKNSFSHQLYFINLGGYKKDEFEEFHYKMIIASSDKGTAIQTAKQTAFFKHTHFGGANSHIDDKYGVDVDDICDIEEMLAPAIKEKYAIELTPAREPVINELHLGYFKLDAL